MADKKITELTNGCASMPGDTTVIARGGADAYVDLGRWDRNGQLNRWRAALAKYRAGSANARVFVGGDSIAKGYGASTTANLQAVNAIHAVMARKAIQLGEKASYGSFMGNGNLTMSTFDSRISQSTWAVNSGFVSVGGDVYSTSGTPTFGFTPDQVNNTCDIWYIQYSGGGTFTKQANAVTGTDVATTNATPLLVKTSLTAASAINTNLYKVIGKTAGSGIFFVGMETYDLTNKSLVFINGGWFTAECDFWTQNGQADNAWNPNNCWDELAYDLVIFDCGGNDIKDGKTISYMKTEYQKIITAVKAQSDMILTITAAPATTWITAQQMLDYRTAIYELAATNNLPVLDLYSAWGGNNYTAMNALGMYRATDEVHLSQFGYSDFGNKLATMVLNP